MELYKTISDALLIARSKRGISQARAAKALKCSERSFKSWEKKIRPRAYWLPKISKFVGLPLHKTFELWKQSA